MAKLELSGTDFPQDSIVVRGANLEPIFNVVVENELLPRLCHDKYIFLEVATVKTNSTKGNPYLLEKREILG